MVDPFDISVPASRDSENYAVHIVGQESDY